MTPLKVLFATAEATPATLPRITPRPVGSRKAKADKTARPS